MHTINVSYVGDSIAENATQTKDVNVFNNAKISASDVIGDTTLEMTSKQHQLINTETHQLTVVEFTVDGKVYKVKTNAKGVATLSIKLAVGNHKITVKNPSDGSNITKAAKIVKRITNNKNVNVFYLTKATYKVRIYGDNGKVVGKGVKVKFTVGKKVYYRYTDKNGYATLKVSLKSNTYKVTAEFKGYKVTNKIKVKHIIKAKKTTTVEKSKKVLKIKVTLKGKKVFKKKKLTIKFKGKKYKVKTNKKGVAYFKVNKNVLNKLKKGKKYKYTITYKKDKLTRCIKVKQGVKPLLPFTFLFF